jgi:hypothetical protein
MKQKQQGVKENQASTTAAMLHEKEILYGKQWQVAGISKVEDRKYCFRRVMFGCSRPWASRRNSNLSRLPVRSKPTRISFWVREKLFRVGIRKEEEEFYSDQIRRKITSDQFGSKVSTSYVDTNNCGQICVHHARHQISRGKKISKEYTGINTRRSQAPIASGRQSKSTSAEPVQLLHVKDGQGLAHQDPKKEPCSDRFRQSKSTSAEPLQLLHVKDGKGSSLKEK